MTTRTRDYLLRKLERRSRETAREMRDAADDATAFIRRDMVAVHNALRSAVGKEARIASREVDRLRIHLRDRLGSIEAILRPVAIQYRAFDELTGAARQPGRMPTLGEVIGSDLDKHQFDPIVAAREIQDAYQGPEVHAVRQPDRPGDPPGP